MLRIAVNNPDAMVVMSLGVLAAYATNKFFKLATGYKAAYDLIEHCDQEDDDVVDHLLVVDDPLVSTVPDEPPLTDNSAESEIGTEGPIVNQEAPPLGLTNPIGELEYDYSRPRNRNRYVKVLVQKIKARFGTAHDTDANRLVMRRYLHDYMVKRKNRPSVIAKTIPIVLEMCFIPDHDEVRLRQIASHPIVRKRKAYGQVSWTDWFFMSTYNLLRPPKA